MSQRRILITLVLAAGMAGCGETARTEQRDVPPIAAALLPTSAEEPLLIELFRKVLGGASHSEPVYLSTSVTFGAGPADPPEGVMTALADLNLDLKPVSALTSIGEISNAHPLRGQVYWVAIERRVSSSQLLLDIGSAGHGWARGQKWIFKLEGDRWVAVEMERSWSSSQVGKS